MTLEDLADATCVRKSYLIALEELKLDQLPSRPFTIGYVRAVAHALDLDPDQAVARFKIDAPDRSEPLRPPLGVTRERDPRLTLFAGGAAVVICAVLVWNLAQHALAEGGQPAPAIPDVAPRATPKAPAGAVVLGPPLPAPADSDLPPPYLTPGLVENMAAAEAEAQGTPAPAPVVVEDSGPLPPAPPNPRAAVYGAAAEQSPVRLQARKSASVVVRGGDGRVYFARVLASGESYRPPTTQGLTIDVSDPKAFDVYSADQFKGQMPAAQTPISKLAG